MTALVNNGVTVALIGSRNFSRMMAHVERKCPIWAGNSFMAGLSSAALCRTRWSQPI